MPADKKHVDAIIGAIETMPNKIGSHTKQITVSHHMDTNPYVQGSHYSNTRVNVRNVTLNEPVSPIVIDRFRAESILV